MKESEDGLVKVFHGVKTLEYDLALHEANRSAMLKALKELHPKIGETVEASINAASGDAEKARILFSGMFERKQNNVQKGRFGQALAQVLADGGTCVVPEYILKRYQACLPKGTRTPMTNPSPEQSAIISAPLAPVSVIACAGSGKTHTAVRRLAEMRRLLGKHRGRVALLSFSNIAVDTFRKSYQSLALEMSVDLNGHRVDIDTLDSFITRHVLHPHAHRTMQATQAAFLVTGGESFLSGFTFKPGNYPVGITSMQAGGVTQASTSTTRTMTKSWN